MATIPSDLVTVRRLENFATALATKTDARYLQAAGLGIERLSTPEEGYFASYQLKNGSTVLGDTINIPKDYVVKSASVQVCQTADVPVSGLVPGDKYLDFVVNTKDSESSTGDQHLYIPVKDFAVAYTEGNGIDISAQNAISIEIDATNANGLSVSANGLALAEAVAATSGAGGSAGAMSAVDKEKIDSLVEATETEITTIVNGLWPSP